MTSLLPIRSLVQPILKLSPAAASGLVVSGLLSKGADWEDDPLTPGRLSLEEEGSFVNSKGSFLSLRT
ncbi:hypothetical protein D9M71_648480 [compost metagenome]